MLNLPEFAKNEHTAGAIAHTVRLISYCVYGSRADDETSQVWSDVFEGFNFDVLVHWVTHNREEFQRIEEEYLRDYMYECMYALEKAYKPSNLASMIKTLEETH